MQNDTHMYEVPADRLIYNHKGLGERRELGEATVTCNMWGKPSIHIQGEQGTGPARGWWLIILAVAAAVAISLAWFFHKWPFSLPHAATAPQSVEQQQAPQQTPAADVPMAQPAEPETSPQPDTAAPTLDTAAPAHEAPRRTANPQPAPVRASTPNPTATAPKAASPSHGAPAKHLARHSAGPASTTETRKALANPVAATSQKATDPAPAPSAKAKPAAKDAATPPADATDGGGTAGQ